MTGRGFISLSLAVVFSAILAFANTFGFARVLLHHIKNNFDCPTIITAYIHLQPASCHKNDGGIYGISGTGVGVHTFTWHDANNNVVGSDSLLVNVPAGSYTVQMKDESKCTGVTAGPFIVPLQTGIRVDDSKIVITQATCTNSDGSITGIKIVNAVSYKWVGNDTTKVLATTPDLLNVPIGMYKLRMFNSEGCETDSDPYIVYTQTKLPVFLNDTVSNPTCNDVTGEIIIHLLTPRGFPAEYFYLNGANGNSVAYGKLIYLGTDLRIHVSGLGNGVFTLYVGDLATCVLPMKTYILQRPTFAIDTSKIVAYDDHCGQHTGTIGPASVIGGSVGIGKIQYIWTDDKGNVVGHYPYAAHLAAGRYKLSAYDVMKCSAESGYFTVKDITTGVLPPRLTANQLCLPGEAYINVQNLTAGYTYRLYTIGLSGDTVLIGDNSTGKFLRTVSQTTPFFVTASDGSCESHKATVTVTVAEPGVNIPSLFSPNHDGINDVWNVTGLANYPGTVVNIYDRSGALLFTSIGYGKPFDGTRNGMPLPAGVYYYTIDLKKKSCGAASGSVTILR